MSKDTRSESVILLVDDDLDALDLYALLFALPQVTLLTAESGLHALDVLRTKKVHLLVSDYSMPGMNGIALLNEAHRLYPDMGLILYTGTSDAEVLLEAVPHKVLTKGMHLPLVQRAILRELKRHGG